MSKHISPHRLELSDEEYQTLVVELLIQNRHLSQVNMYLLCALLETGGGLTREQVDDTLEMIHAGVKDQVDRNMARYSEMPDQMRNMLRDILGGFGKDDPEDEQDS